MVDTLKSEAVGPFIEAPGVALVAWEDPRNVVSLAFDTVFELAAREHEDARFGRVDVTDAEPLAREYELATIPALVVYRDGTLVYAQEGPLPERALHALVDAVWLLDMNEVRQGVDGQGARVFLAFRPDRSPPFEDLTSGGGAAPPSGVPRQ
jgi:hypothetical protein